jgi:hypothetical protein
MGVSGYCRVRDVHIRQVVVRYRKALGELNYCTRRNHHSGKIELLQRTCTVLAQAVVCLQPHIDLETLRAIRFSPPAPFTNAELTRKILAELRRKKMPQCAASLAGDLLKLHRISLATPEERTAFFRQVRNRLLKLSDSRVLRNDGETWQLLSFYPNFPLQR